MAVRDGGVGDGERPAFRRAVDLACACLAPAGGCGQRLKQDVRKIEAVRRVLAEGDSSRRGDFREMLDPVVDVAAPADRVLEAEAGLAAAAAAEIGVARIEVE